MKKIANLLLTLLFIASFSISVFAADVTEVNDTEGPTISSDAWNCIEQKIENKKAEALSILEAMPLTVSANGIDYSSYSSDELLNMYAHIVKEQIKIASGESLEFTQKDINFNGHAIECRINAENPDKNFRPCPGKITELNLPGGNGVRIDTAVYTGYTIPPVYDSMIAKIIVHAENRTSAIAKMKRALEECVIEGIDTNIDFLFKILSNDHFVNNDYDTSFIEKFM